MTTFNILELKFVKFFVGFLENLRHQNDILRLTDLYHLQWKFKLMAGKFAWGVKAKHCLSLTTNFWKQKVWWHNPVMFCLITSSKLSPNSVQCSGDNIWIGISSKIQPFCPKSFGNHRFFFSTEKYQSKEAIFYYWHFFEF